MLPLSFVIASAPVLPPLGFLLLVCWQLLRPGLLPLWAGFPLGLFDDLFSGQPFGSAIFLWSATMIALEVLSGWLRWRGFWQDWLVANVTVVCYLVLALCVAALAGGPWNLLLIVPQTLLAFVMFPLLTRLVALLDLLRLARVRVVA
ncbi:rod shape-determining protein MreD [Croceicoccus sp. F390]|uniref:Rod shape-determining protein MreD n=1 Tax=Croceicoccus esteveae TaxID=3075597 RepID=A0ABU2ZJ41_9SPHN|nr:rod shape-determining protein MreD [Croceicoccus sp. F390]MDT0576609.1 rod shape-determining protein MreD [Croceicoccus sp. F390]